MMLMYCLNILLGRKFQLRLALRDPLSDSCQSYNVVVDVFSRDVCSFVQELDDLKDSQLALKCLSSFQKKACFLCVQFDSASFDWGECNKDLLSGFVSSKHCRHLRRCLRRWADKAHGQANSELWWQRRQRQKKHFARFSTMVQTLCSLIAPLLNHMIAVSIRRSYHNKLVFLGRALRNQRSDSLTEPKTKLFVEDCFTT